MADGSERLDPCSPEWGEALDAWRMAHWRLGCERLKAYDERGRDEQRVRAAKRELAAAEAAFAASDTEAKRLQQQVEDMLRDGESRGFRP